MLRRILAIIALTFAPAGVAHALPAGPIQGTPWRVDGAFIDKIVKEGTVKDNKAQQIMGYTFTVRDDTYEYVLPACADMVIVDANAKKLIDPLVIVPGSAAVINVRPHQPAAAKACIERVALQQFGRTSTNGECLQNYQIKHEIEGAPNPVEIKKDYIYRLTVYSRPTLDCDAATYGNNPIVTTLAAKKQFTVWLERDTPTGAKELMRWAVTTDQNGKASFPYNFAVENNTYKFYIKANTNSSAGDVIQWTEKVVDPSPDPTPVPDATNEPSGPPVALIIGLLAVVLLGAGAFEAIHLMRRRRAGQSPVDEYLRTPKL